MHYKQNLYLIIVMLEDDNSILTIKKLFIYNDMQYYNLSISSNYLTKLIIHYMNSIYICTIMIIYYVTGYFNNMI